ncbi:16S rRNA (cytosine(967)-C(5))-methyltransferase RsmB [Anaerococcus prevotii]|uniref:16S rRNA (cytosine(967)-C(5))-methyltransferase n=1 Tax=Anaerococcus prevotii ACS-065-V-Col13 TaxID=879305 RepID=F0GWJ2_9FIRM|nr:16S rRNA (cytosine(967)-C(5))-methyltransferase RsmB [Anaerococcus prevotii]EGC81863.1 putative ribosomal RNA small subunit methyltransferase B [Anaerococcus prevotii ACS-065-V-Col13]
MTDLELIFNSLSNIIYKDKKSNDEINYLSDKASNLSYITKVIYGVLENKIYLDYMIDKLSKVKLRKIHKNVLLILEIGIYNIHFLETKDYATVDKLVDLTKKKNKRSAGFVNAILRNFIRNEKEISKIKISDDLKSLSVRYSMPYDITKYIFDNYGMDYTKEFLRYANKESKLSIRVNTTKINVKSLKKDLESIGYTVKDSNISKNALIVDNPNGLVSTDLFKNGLFTIQQEASMKTVEVLNPRHNSNILDICAAPGTKTTYIAEYTENTGKILANDISFNKLDLIMENINRLGLRNIELTNFDARVYKDEYKEKFDYILVDAPCSGLGVMARKPEIRYNRSLEDIKKLAKLQREIIINAIKYLKVGGVLIYSTCTIGNIENRENFDYIKNMETMEVIPIDGKDYIEFVSFKENTDGFFISKFKKK